jgi:predicted amino acid racemase
MGYPCVVADLDKILENVNHVAELCHSRGMTFAAVAKCVCADKPILDTLERSRCDWLAEARLSNLAAMKTQKPRFLIRIAQPWEVADLVSQAEISLQSEIATIRLLGAEAARQNRRHKVILACDLGDLREGCFFRNREDIFATAQAVLAQPSLELYGVGMNLGCFGGVLPCEENMNGLVDIARALREKFQIPLPIVSGGSTILIHHLLAGTIPPDINNARMGELWLCGHDPGLNRNVPGFLTDCFTLQAQLVEVKEKPSKPIGPIGGDAFGHVIQRPDLGMMRRGILACGKQDLDLECLYPVDKRLSILGGSSDHTLVDLTQAPEYQVGDIVEFHMGYGAILRAYTSHYVDRRYRGRENP